MSVITAAFGYRLTAPGGAFAAGDLAPFELAPDDVIVEVAACGLCHTDVGFAFGGVPTRHALPLVLGHEISGRVIDSGEHAASWIGKSVIVPAVIPCGACEPCRIGRPTICRNQFMPGNDGDGGFATHVRVPSRGLCAVPGVLPDGVTLEMLSVVADAVTTPFEAIERANVQPDDLAIFVGAGGVGGFGVQIAAARGAKVVAIDIDESRLELASQHGASVTMTKRDKNAIRALGIPSHRWKIFETSGTAAGQETAFSLIDSGSYLAVVGFTPQKIELRLSNLMAFDATARGNWGCAPDHYPKALELVLQKKVAIAPFIDLYALDVLPDLFEAARNHELRKRPVVVPR